MSRLYLDGKKCEKEMSDEQPLSINICVKLTFQTKSELSRIKLVPIEDVIFVIIVACTSAMKDKPRWPAHREKIQVSNFYFDLLI